MQRKYTSLQKKYRQLDNNYRAITKNPRIIKKEMKKMLSKRVPTLISIPIGIWGIIYYKHYAIILIGILAMLGDLVWEEYNTRKGIWKYEKSKIIMIFGRVPLGVPMAYFFIGAALATYILFRIGFVPGV